MLSPQEVWTGLTVPVNGNRTRVCKGLLDDWSSWIREQGTIADLMARVLGKLTVQGEALGVGPILRLSVNDAQDIPSIKTEYSDTVPIVHASAGVRRIAALAYMLVWAWTEHLGAAEQLGSEHTKQIVLLFDEIEAHLHPRWQRAVLPALLEVMDTLASVQHPNVQLVAATHSPLVLSSVEPLFDEERDRLFHPDLRAGSVQASQPGRRRGAPSLSVVAARMLRSRLLPRPRTVDSVPLSSASTRCLRSMRSATSARQRAPVSRRRAAR